MLLPGCGPTGARVPRFNWLPPVCFRSCCANLALFSSTIVDCQRERAWFQMLRSGLNRGIWPSCRTSRFISVGDGFGPSLATLQRTSRCPSITQPRRVVLAFIPFVQFRIILLYTRGEAASYLKILGAENSFSIERQD